MENRGLQNDSWKGANKLAEECNELCVVLAKLAAYPDGNHPDGAGDLKERLIEEMGDVAAALRYFAEANDLDKGKLAGREHRKVQTFRGWDMSGFRPLHCMGWDDLPRDAK